jgi:hypothetical protein
MLAPRELVFIPASPRQWWSERMKGTALNSFKLENRRGCGRAAGPQSAKVGHIGGLQA